MQQLQKLAARTHCGLGTLERDPRSISKFLEASFRQLPLNHRDAEMRQLQKLVARTDCGLGALERDLRSMEASARQLRSQLASRDTELAAARQKSAMLHQQLEEVRPGRFISQTHHPTANGERAP